MQQWRRNGNVMEYDRLSLDAVWVLKCLGRTSKVAMSPSRLVTCLGMGWGRVHLALLELEAYGIDIPVIGLPQELDVPMVRDLPASRSAREVHEERRRRIPPQTPLAPAIA